MGLESEPVRIRAAGGPTRCPFCHADVLREEEASVACDGCLARHHTACWSEGKGCANCGETRFLSREQALAKPAQAEAPPPLAPLTERDIPTIQLELRGERGLVEGQDSLPLVARPGHAVEAAAIVIANKTDRPRTVELRHLPPWAIARESVAVIEPGRSARFELGIRAALAPFQTVAARADSGMTNGMKNPVPDLVRGTFVVWTADDSRAIALDVERALSDAQLRWFAFAMGLAFHVGIVFAGIYAARGKTPRRKAFQSHAEHLLEVRRAEANARMARLIGRALCVTIPLLAAIVTTLILLTRR